jgi:tripartite-type tricarboxylate transporter receptor subunit TctC
MKLEGLLPTMEASVPQGIMAMPTRFFRCVRTALLLAIPSIASAQGGAYPDKPITLLVGYQAGGSVDLVARTIAPPLAKRLGQTIVVENAAGAGGTIACSKVVAAAKDGYTLLLGSTSEIGINHLTQKKPRYNPMQDLLPIGLVGSQPMVLVTRGANPIGSASEFIAHLTQSPGKAMYASPGVGTPLHLAGEMLKKKANVFMVHIPYRGAAGMTTDLLGGQVEYAVFMLSSALPYIKDGRMKALGVTSAARNPSAPQIPALGQSAKLKGFDMSVLFGVLAPAGTPAPIVARLRTELKAVVKDPEVRKKLQDAGLALDEEADFGKLLSSEIEKFKPIVAFANIAED